MMTFKHYVKVAVQMINVREDMHTTLNTEKSLIKCACVCVLVKCAGVCVGLFYIKCNSLYGFLINQFIKNPYKPLHNIYSGYGKYSDPLKFFTLCYIAAIC